MEVIIIAALLGIIPGMIAKSKGRSAGLWWFYGFMVFIVALPHALIMKSLYQCPHCKSNVDQLATVCPKCSRDIV